MLISLSIIVFLIILYFIFEWSWLIPSSGNVAILMYHKVTHSQNDSLSITIDYLRKQFDYILSQEYKVVSFTQLMEIEASAKNLSGKYLVLTFDDGYKNNKDLLLPLLDEYGFCAAIFLTVGYIGKENVWDGGGEPLLSFEEIKMMSRLPNIEFGFHSYEHKAYSQMKADEIENDIAICKNIFQENKIPYIPVLAYPYGAYPKKDKKKKENLFDILKKMGIRYALRIGNGMNVLSFNKPYEIKRINIRGSDSFLEFKVKLKKGHRKLFE